MGEQQRYHVLQASHFGQTGLTGAVAQQLDGVLAFLEAFVDRLDLLLSQLVVRDVVAVVGMDQAGEFFNGTTH